MDPSQHRRELHRGFGDALARAFEFAASLAIFVGLGWLVDRALDTQPWFMIGLGVFCLVGQFIKVWYAYDADMRRHEAAFREERLR